ncbi:MAG: NUDIX domain-containing protein [Streptosporangiales bacterium]|nr:NUDIX domain-containing protein [Streptosporangiales bacterium]
MPPCAAAIIRDESGAILLQRRADSGRWSLPGGKMHIGETIADCLRREVLEETGLHVEPTTIAGIYTDPDHRLAYDDGEVRQEFTVVFHTRTTGGHLRLSHESTELEYIPLENLHTYDIHPTVHLRIHHATHNATPHIG